MFGERLKKLREQSSMIQDEVSEKLGISARTLGYYENEDRRPNPEMIVKLADFYNVTSDYILGLSDNPHNNYELSNSEVSEKATIVKILGNIRAGQPLFTREHIKGEILMSNKTLTSGYQHFILEVTGDSMVGDNIKEGDMILIRVQNYIDYEGQIAAVVIGEESCLKHVYTTENKDYIILRSSNEKYQDIVSSPNQIHINGVLAGYFNLSI